ncbi:transmembrane protein, putative (macronuclear) [Tetrahymena thermophila SB210]|uniref:Transmembrane protein, putative n=1 Tax=Tetrahymena thermophila (strain SB210) TaxID=312017 RepID=I7MK08_TETTS|nr:transmembrane protein, putative [Tetrahymena thermophila SB210]EAS07718.2 transmembrane protein, putative [Tetrahymena thermophila SB210]|eukprot:XP_001027960.2 transmembrane protein, putative [Tetrahymena thermophila SB210]
MNLKQYIFKQTNKNKHNMRALIKTEYKFQVRQLIFLITILLVARAQSCSISGCKQCSSASNSAAQTCSQCYDGFVLTQQGICQYTMCQKWEFLQNYTDSSNQIQQRCVSVCGSKEIPNLSSRVCQSTYQCTSSYSFPTSTNNGQQIKYIYFGTKDQLIYLVYSTFMNMIDQYTGSFITSVSFPSGIQAISLAQNRLFLLNTNTKQILEWIPTNSTANVLTTVVKGYAKVFSNVYIFGSNQVVYTSYNDDGSIIYFNVIGQGGLSSCFDQVNLTSPTKIISFFDYFILTQNRQSFQIQVLYLSQQQTNQQLFLFGNTQNFYCNSISGQSIDGKSIQQQQIQQYYLIFQNTLYLFVYQIDQSNNIQCNQIQLTYQPLNLQILNANLCPNQQSAQQVLLISNANNQILVYNISNLQQIQLGYLQFSSNIISFNYLLDNQNLNIYALLSNSIIDIRQVIFDCSNPQNIQISSKSFNQLASLIKNPKYLILLKALQNDQKLKNYIISINQEAQIIDGQISQSKSIIKDFQDRIFANNGQISKMLYNEKHYFISSCSQDGLIMVWKAIDPLKPEYLYQIRQQGQKCLNILDYQQTYIVALFSNQIIIFNLFNQLDQQIYPIDSTQYNNILVNSQYICLIINNNAIVIDSSRQTVAQNNQIQFTTLVNTFLTEQNQIITINTSNLISIYTIKLSQQTIQNSLLQFQSPYAITCSQFFSITGGTHIVIFDSNLTLTVFDQNLQVLQTFSVTIGKVFIIKSFEEGKYLLGIQLNQILDYNYYSTLYFDVSSNSQTQIGTYFYATDFVQFKKTVNNYGQNVIILVPLQPLSYTSLTYEVYYTIGQDSIFTPYGRFTYTPTQYVVTALSNKAQSLIITGSLAGQLRVAPMYNDRKLFQIVFNSLSTNQADNINKVFQSFILGRYFVFTSVINCFSLHTDQLLETITFSTNTEPIQNFQISDSLQVLIAYISNEIILRNFSQPNLKYSLKLSSQQCLLKKINSLFLDENTQEIFLYGDGLIKFSLKLNQQTVLSSQSTLNIDNYQQCLFPAQIAVCLINKQNLVFFDRTSNYSLFQQILLQDILAGASILVDQANQQVFVYKTYIEVYTFTGSYLKGLSDVAYPIITFSIYDQHIVVMTSAAIYIYLRGTLQYMSYIQPSGGAFAGYLYIKSQSLIAYYTTQIQYGQILLYSLTTYSQAGFMTNTYQQNKVGQVVKMVYDDDNTMFNYIDVFGNFQNVLNNAQKTTDSTYSIEEIQAGVLPPPIDYQLDFKSNTALIYNGQRVWRQNYCLFTRPYQRIYSRPANHYFQINQQGGIYFIIADYNNNIYMYQNQEMTFYSYFTLNILDMRQIQRGALNRFIFFFQSQILIYFDLGNQFSQNSPNQKLTDYQFKRVLLQNADRLIINTSDNYIVDYDFFNQSLINKIQLNALEDITTSLLVGSSQSNKWQYVYGTDQGRVGVYDLIIGKLIYVQFKLNNINPISQIQMYSSDNFICLDNIGNIHQINTSSFLEFDSQPLQSAVNQITSQIYGSVLKVIQLIQFDLTNQRAFINFQSERYIIILSLQDYSFITYLSFPDNEWKQIVFGNQYLLICSFFQINVYFQNSLSFVGYARRYNRKDRITDIRLIDENKIIVVFVNRIESLYIQAQTGSILLVDTLTLNDSKILYANLISTERLVNYIGVASNTIFEKKINYGLYENSYSATSLSQNANCYFQIQYQNFITSLTSFQQAYATRSLSLLYFLSVYIGSYIDNMNFLNQNSLSIVFRPQNQNQNSLQIQQNSFQSMNFDLQMDSFSLDLTNSQQIIKLNQNSQNFILQNISLSNQTLSQNTQLLFNQKNNIILSGFNISNLSLISGNRLLEVQNQQINSKYYLFNFTNCQNLVISNMIIDNLKINTLNQSLIYSMKTAQITIRNLTVQNSMFNSLIDIFQSTNIIFQNILIYNCSNSLKQQNTYFIQLIGIISQQISNFTAQNNRDLQLLLTDKSYNLQNQGTVVLSIDALTFDGGNIFNNTFPSTIDKINTQNILIAIKTTSVNISNLNYQSNEGNIQFLTNTVIQINKSKFQNNQGVLGGSLYAQDIVQGFQIYNSVFYQNKVSGSGGSIYLNNINQFTIDSYSSITNSSASIGGAIRIINLDVNLWKKYLLNCLMQYNFAEIYGNNIGTLPQVFQVQQLDPLTETQNYIKIYEGILNNIQKSINFSNQQSGGLFQLKIQLLDDDRRPLSVNQTKYKNNIYEQTVMQELNSYFIQVEINQNATSQTKENSFIELKGQSLIGIKQYDEITKMFSFESLTLTSLPLVSISSVSIQFNFNSLGYSVNVPTLVSFRPCKQGEILASSQTQIDSESINQSYITLISCQECTQGMYSLSDPQVDYSQYLQNNDIKIINSQVCKQCPNFVSNCFGNQMTLEDGYWRSNNQTDEILQCNFMNPDICSEQVDSINGCIEGYLGPICEKCDTIGQVWGKRYSQSFQQFQCQECSNEFYQKTIISVSVIVVFLYLYMSIFLFMGRYTYESLCYYFRFLKLLPFSKSCTLDESSYYIKVLINYLQLSSLLFTFYMKFIPSFLSSIPSAAGSPSSKLVISTQCLFSSDMYKNYGEERIMIVGQSLLPFLTFLLFLILLAVMNKLKLKGVGNYHKYTMFNIVFLFFQPDCLSFFTKALSCRKIGDQKFQIINILINCDDESYIKFSNSFVLPNLLFWVFAPLVQLYYLRKDKGKNNENFDKCILKYKYGFFYVEFKPNYYFWEFCRMYLKIIIIIITTLLNDYQDFILILSIIIIFSYVLIVMKFQPFKSNSLFKLELISYLLLIPSIFLFYMSRQYSSQVFQILMGIIHYCYMGYMILVIIKFKLDNQTSSANKLLKYIVQKLCCRIFTSKMKLNEKKSGRVLMNWRKVYLNQTKIKLENLNQNLNKLQSQMLNRSLTQSQAKQSKNQEHTNMLSQLQGIMNKSKMQIYQDTPRDYTPVVSHQNSIFKKRQSNFAETFQDDQTKNLTPLISDTECKNSPQRLISKISQDTNQLMSQDAVEQGDLTESLQKCFVQLASSEINAIKQTQEFKKPKSHRRQNYQLGKDDQQN